MASISHVSLLFLVSFAMNQMIYSNTAAASTKINNNFPAVFAFGDSILDTGNNNLLNTSVKCDFPPYGRDFFTRKPTGRFSNGKLIIDFLGIYNMKDNLPSFCSYFM